MTKRREKVNFMTKVQYPSIEFQSHGSDANFVIANDKSF